jgi:hypothetical protein
MQKFFHPAFFAVFVLGVSSLLGLSACGSSDPMERAEKQINQHINAYRKLTQSLEALAVEKPEFKAEIQQVLGEAETQFNVSKSKALSDTLAQKESAANELRGLVARLTTLETKVKPPVATSQTDASSTPAAPAESKLGADATVPVESKLGAEAVVPTESKLGTEAVVPTESKLGVAPSMDADTDAQAPGGSGFGVAVDNGDTPATPPPAPEGSGFGSQSGQ